MTVVSCNEHTREASKVITDILFGMHNRDHLLLKMRMQWELEDPDARKEEVFRASIEFFNM